MNEKDAAVMKKVDLMDKYLDSCQGEITSSEICSIVQSIFGFDLETKPVLSKEGDQDSPPTETTAKLAIDLGIEPYGKNISGSEIRKIINEIFSINLDAISSLDGSRISLYSKEQWVTQQEHDLFVVHTGVGDIDVKIFPTAYFTEKTGLTELPEELKQSLTSLGYYYNDKIGSFYYSNPSGEATPDSFKGQTIGAILKFIHQSYQNL